MMKHEGEKHEQPLYFIPCFSISDWLFNNIKESEGKDTFPNFE